MATIITNLTSSSSRTYLETQPKRSSPDGYKGENEFKRLDENRRYSESKRVKEDIQLRQSIGPVSDSELRLIGPQKEAFESYKEEVLADYYKGLASLQESGCFHIMETLIGVRYLKGIHQKQIEQDELLDLLTKKMMDLLKRSQAIFEASYEANELLLPELFNRLPTLDEFHSMIKLHNEILSTHDERLDDHLWPLLQAIWKLAEKYRIMFNEGAGQVFPFYFKIVGKICEYFYNEKGQRIRKHKMNRNYSTMVEPTLRIFSNQIKSLLERPKLGNIRLSDKEIESLNYFRKWVINTDTFRAAEKDKIIEYWDIVISPSLAFERLLKLKQDVQVPSSTISSDPLSPALRLNPNAQLFPSVSSSASLISPPGGIPISPNPGNHSMLSSASTRATLPTQWPQMNTNIVQVDHVSTPTTTTISTISSATSLPSSSSSSKDLSNSTSSHSQPILFSGFGGNNTQAEPVGQPHIQPQQDLFYREGGTASLKNSNSIDELMDNEPWEMVTKINDTDERDETDQIDDCSDYDDNEPEANRARVNPSADPGSRGNGPKSI